MATQGRNTGARKTSATSRKKVAQKAAPAAKPRTGKKKGGRPFIGRVARVHISLTVTPQTQAALKREARKRGLSIGLLVDDLTEPFRGRRP
jgi:hypothetical protein